MRSFRNSAAHHEILRQVEQANSEDAIYVITGNLSGHDGKSVWAWPGRPIPSSATPFIRQTAPAG